MAISSTQTDALPEDLVNEFIFRCTIRTAMINRMIQTARNRESVSEERYLEMCLMVLRHANDIRLAADCIDGLALESSEKEALKQMLKLVSVESMIYSLGHMLIHMKGLQAASNINTCFIRRTKKFWIHPDNVETVLSLIIPYLPVYIFGDDGSGRISSTISSVYFDTPEFYLYEHRIKRDQGAKALRIRKYGESSFIAYVELKTHEDGWTGERSTKRRFLIHTKLIPIFSQGIDVWDEIKSINAPEAHSLYAEVLSLIGELGLVPVVKTAYTRTAFQFPEDSSVRLSMDTNLTMWNGLDGKSFPYAILEVKLEEGAEPEWIVQLMNTPLVIPVDKFSKYLHACSVHYPDVPSVPYWYNQIRTCKKRAVEIEQDLPTDPKLLDISEELIKILLRLKNIASHLTSGFSSAPTTAQPSAFSSTYSSAAGSNYALPTIQNRTDPNTTQTMAGEKEKSFYESTSLIRPQSDAVPAADADKPIIVPVRIEPKVFFANERTFLSWLHFAIFIGGIGAALMGLGDRQAALSGVCFVVVSVIFSLYALYLYFWRANQLKNKNPGPYDDHNGPMILVAVFLSAMITSVFFKFPLK
ncbi:hypothetical protein NEDG_00984 [Nematocida displodere]|uniref:Vacuolar transporter chaperone 4 n=1 Tax=Nematocida displodere TaxID=1805483 RepID=A0A177EAA5_9MICR|nr:hypothetical protein NEDG_00984 [Nematocida displodere]